MSVLPTPTANLGIIGGSQPPAKRRAAGHSPTVQDIIEHLPDRFGPYGPAIDRWERVLGRPAPDPTEPGIRGGQRLSPRFVEWMMGLPDGWVTGHGLTRSAALKCLGNGVVPQQATAALAAMAHNIERKPCAT